MFSILISQVLWAFVLFFFVHGFAIVLRYNLDFFFFLICSLSSRQLQWGKNTSQACDYYIHPTVYKTDNQQGPTV